MGRFAGTTAVAVYGVGGQINTLYLQFSTSISNVFVPKVNKIVAESNDNEQLTKTIYKGRKDSIFGIGTCFVRIHFLWKSFL